MKTILSILSLMGTMILIKSINVILYKTIEENGKYYFVKKKVVYFLSILWIIIILFIWSDATANLTTYIGLLSAGIAIALRELFTNIAGWLFIEIRQPFDVGHRILIGDQKGDVIDIRLFQFSLMEVSNFEDGEQSTGRIIDVPNNFIFLHPLVNYTKGFKYIWNEIKCLLTFESDWILGKELLTEIANKNTTNLTTEAQLQVKKAAKKYMIHYNKLTPIVYTDVKESGIQLTIRYLCAPKQRRITANNIWEDILNIVKEHDHINLAYPTQRLIK